GAEAERGPLPARGIRLPELHRPEGVVVLGVDDALRDRGELLVGRRAAEYAVEGVVHGGVDVVGRVVADVGLQAALEHAVGDRRELGLPVREHAGGSVAAGVPDVGERHAVDGAAHGAAGAAPVEDAVLPGGPGGAVTLEGAPGHVDHDVATGGGIGRAVAVHDVEPVLVPAAHVGVHDVELRLLAGAGVDRDRLPRLGARLHAGPRDAGVDDRAGRGVPEQHRVELGVPHEVSAGERQALQRHVGRLVDEDDDLHVGPVLVADAGGDAGGGHDLGAFARADHREASGADDPAAGVVLTGRAAHDVTVLGGVDARLDRRQRLERRGAGRVVGTVLGRDEPARARRAVRELLERLAGL